MRVEEKKNRDRKKELCLMPVNLGLDQQGPLIQGKWVLYHR